jgi:hypothetical protein
MRGRRVRAVAVSAVAAAAFAACGGSEKPPEPPPGKTVSGQTERGMKMTVETFVDPADDPTLKRIEDWRAKNKYPEVDFHRVTADNTEGKLADSGRSVRFARTRDALMGGESVEARFSCDVLQYEWIPLTESDNAAWGKLREDVCADGPPKEDGIQPGDTKVYYLVTDRDFSARNIRGMNVFGPLDEQFVESN